MMHPVCLTLDLREFMMPNIMNGLKAADEVRVKRRQLLIAMAVAMVIGLAVSYYSAIKISYAHGAPLYRWQLVYAATRRTSDKSEDKHELDKHWVYGIRQRPSRSF